MDNWRSGCSIGSLYVFANKFDLERIGDCWMNGRVKIGDITMCIGHSGDCFHNFILLKHGVNFIKGIPESKFGAYNFGVEIKSWCPTMREFHLLCAGETLTYGIDIKLESTVPYYHEYQKIIHAPAIQPTESEGGIN